MQKTFFFTSVVFVILIFLLTDCAREYTPTGGPKDTLAPVVVKEIPANKSLNFDKKKFVVKFDEYFKLDKVKEQLMISPPVEVKPDVKVRKKKMVVKLKNTDIKPNSSYSFNFSEIIKDITEKNVLKEYIYSFSTGTILDSLKISGHVKNAFNNAIPESVTILVHSDLSDSAVVYRVPDYATKTNKDGFFTINNIAEGSYRVYALADQNKNYLYDLPSELFGFYDTIVVPSVKDTIYYDTLQVDSVFVVVDSLGKETTDTITIDSIATRIHNIYSPSDLSILLYEANQTNQYVKSFARPKKELFSYGFNIPLKNDSLSVSSILGELKKDQYFLERPAVGDSVNVWILDTALRNNDTLQLVLGYFKTDSTGEVFYHDTIKTRYNKKNDLTKGKFICGVSSAVSSKEKHDVELPYILKISSPVSYVDTSLITLDISYDTTAMKNSRGEFYSTNAEGNEIVTEYKNPPQKEYIPKEKYEKQFVRNWRLGNGRFALYFAKPFEMESVQINLLKFPDLKNWYVAETDETSNSIIAIITNQEIAKLENPALVVAYKNADNKVVDTISFSDLSYTKARRTFRVTKPAIFIPEESLSAKHLDDKLEVYCNNFIDSVSVSGITMVDTDDTLEVPLELKIEISTYSKRRLWISYNWQKDKRYLLRFEKAAITDLYGNNTKEQEFLINAQQRAKEKYYKPLPFNVAEDSLWPREFQIFAKWKPGLSYRLKCYQGAFTDIYNMYSDTSEFQFSTKKEDAYGNLEVEITGVNKPSVLQVIHADKGGVVVQDTLSVNTKILFPNLLAGKYTLKLIDDKNNNGQWDTGDLDKRQLPETVRFFSQNVIVKSKWDNKILWNLDAKETDSAIKETADKKKK